MSRIGMFLVVGRMGRTKRRKGRNERIRGSLRSFSFRYRPGRVR